jgi:hypothetical protein
MPSTPAGFKRQGVTCGWRKLYNEKRHVLFLNKTRTKPIYLAIDHLELDGTLPPSNFSLYFLLYHVVRAGNQVDSHKNLTLLQLV